MQLRLTSRPRAVSRPQRAAKLNVVAFKNAEIKHREQQLSSLAKEFMSAYQLGMAEGPTQAVDQLNKLVDRNVFLSSSHTPLINLNSTGFEVLLDKLVVDFYRRGMAYAKVLLTAVNEDMDTVFMLIENRPRPENGCPSDMDISESKTMRMAGDKASCPMHNYSIIKLDCMLDDTTRKITGIYERHQPALEACPMFPVEQAKPDIGDFDRMHGLAAAWCAAMSSDGNLNDLDAMVDGAHFRHYDAWGLIGRSFHGGNVEEGKDLAWLKNRMKQLQSEYDFKFRVIDDAACNGYNVGFMHYRAKVTPLNPRGRDKIQDGMPFVIDGFQAMMLTPNGKISNVWLFRDLMPMERESFITRTP